jgi:exodeoxyribonuclease VII small subunit
MPKTAPAGGEIPFEKALEELEALVAKMEDGKLPLEDSIAAYQRGAELLKYCEGKLSAAQARVAVLEGELLKDLPEADS